MEKTERKMGAKPGLGRWAAALVLGLGAAAGTGLPQAADCLLAEVDHQTLTVSDIRILTAFGVFDPETPGAPPLTPRAVLDRVIDQKIVIAIGGGELSVPRDEVVSALDDIRAALPSGAFEARLAEFGLLAEDLEPYLEEKLLYREIIDRRFGRRVAVTLEEIEAYYARTYVPARKELGLEPEPLVEMLGDIEAVIRNEKIAPQVRTWVEGLRRQAAVVIKSDCLKILEEERS